MPPPPASSKSYARLIFVHRFFSHTWKMSPSHCAENIVGKAIDFVRRSAQAASGAPTRAASPQSSVDNKLGRKAKLGDHQQREARKRLKAGETCRAIAKTYRVHHATIAKLAGQTRAPRARARVAMRLK